MEQISSIKELRVAGILDELSCFCFPYECSFLELDTVGYIETLEEFHPHLLFLESAWHGLHNHWYKKVYNLSFEIREILHWCRLHHVPTVFWNKEDPVHLDTFLGIAAECDWVYTTDMDCVPLYKRLLKHDRVGVLPFAVCTQSFHPIEKYMRQEKTCFAGGWYALQKERCEDFEKIFDLCSDILGLDIYDRNVYPGNPDYTFPDKYQKNIVGSLPMNKIDIAYKGYNYGITMNTVKYSSTMEARRIYELLACNTISLSNPCTAIQNLFGDLVIVWENEEQFRSALMKIKNVPNYKEKLSLTALRKVMLQHTYEERMQKICKDVLGYNFSRNEKKICIFSVVSSVGEAQRVLRSWQRQSYPSQLVLIAENNTQLPSIEGLTVIEKNQYQRITDIIDADYYCYFSSNHYYGKNYLLDFIVATKYSHNPIIGKASYFKNVLGTYILENRTFAYSMVNKIKCDRCMVEKTIAKSFYTCMQNMEEYVLEGFVATSVDFLNFCQNEHSLSCIAADDLDLNEGYSIDEIYDICSKLPNQEYISIQEQYSGEDFLNTALLPSDSCRTVKFPGGWAGVYALAYNNSKIYAQITTDFLVKKYEKNGYIRIFLDGKTKGKVLFCLNFMDEQGTVIRQVWHTMGLYLRCPVPDGAVRFYYRIIMDADSSFFIREVIFNAFPSNNIALNKEK